MENQPRITRKNYEEMMPDSGLRFGSLISMAYVPYRTMLVKDSHAQVRYLFYDDIIDFMVKKTKALPVMGLKYEKARERYEHIRKLAIKMKNQKEKK